eukprot:Gb_09092 [translate_table: standard]
MKIRHMKKMPINSEVKVTTTTENFAAFGRPAPSSFDTLTLMAALNPRDIMTSHPFKFMQIEIESTAISGFFRCPVKTINIIRYQNSKHSMTAEANESLTKAAKSRKASHENPVHAPGQLPEKI